jgi:class 3 adenylate cyclase
MKQLYLLVLFVSFFAVPHAQPNASVDSLNNSAERILNSDPQQAIEKADQAATLSKKENYSEGYLRALTIKGVAYYKIDHYDKAGKLFNQAIDLSADTKDTVNLTYATYWKGNLELHEGNYSKALDLYQNALSLATASNDKKNLARALDGKASIYEALNETDKAGELYLESFNVATKAGFQDWIPSVVFSLGNVAYSNGNKDAAADKYNEAIKLSEQTGNLNNKANCLQQLAYIAYEKNESKQAMDYIQEALEIFKKTGSETSYSYGRLLMAAILLKDKDWDLAAQLAQNSLQEGKGKKETALQRDAAEILYYAYLGKGNTSKALDFHVLFHQLSEKEHDEDLTRKLTQLELQSNFESERELQKALQQKEKAEMNAQIEKQKLTQKAALVGFIFIAIIAGLAMFAFLQKRKDTRLVASEKQRSDLVLASLLPHDLLPTVKQMSDKEEQTLQTILFIDLKNSSEELTATFTKVFNQVLQKHNLRPVQNHEGLYMAISNDGPAEKHMAQNVIRAGIELIEFIKTANSNAEVNRSFNLGVGVHSGVVIADVLGLNTSEHNVWGDTVNTAARIEQHGMHGKVNISSTTYELVKDDFKCVNYGNLPVTDHQETGMYFIDVT